MAILPKQAMILAAGKGTRMQPLTLTTPKPLIKVGGKPLIVWHIERLYQLGITDIVINIGYLGEQVLNALRAMTLGVQLKFSDETGFVEPLETAGGVRHALSQGLLSDEPFLLINGDVWTDFNVSKLALPKNRLAHLCLVDNPKHNLEGDFVLCSGNVSQKVNTANTNNSLTFAGVSVLSPQLFDGIPEKISHPLAPILCKAMATGKVSGEKITDATWVDVGTLDRLAWLENFLQTQLDKYNI